MSDKVKHFIKRAFTFLKSKQIVYVRDVQRPYEINICDEPRFKNQVAFVSGGSGVIGRAICLRLAAEGALVYVGGTRLEKIEKVVNEIQSLGGVAKPLIINLLEEDSITQAFGTIESQNKKLDLYVDCAGGGARSEMHPICEQSVSVITQIINLNLAGGIITSREAARIMKRNGGGRIVFVSSIVGVRGLKNYSEYAAAKAGIISFATSIAMELGINGIRVNCVSPGIVEREPIDDIKLENIKQTNWLNGYGKPEDIASMVAYLNSEEASFITGQNFIVDGGRSLGLKNSK